jgi:branched-chain amino acid transport system ATP-binding protein
VRARRDSGVSSSIDAGGSGRSGSGSGGVGRGDLVNGAAGRPVLELRDVKRHFGGIRAVDGVTLAIEQSTVTALIGPNGAGKSTLFALMMGEITLTSGEMRLDGRDVRGYSPERRSRLGLGRTFQTPRLFSGLSVQENVRIALLARAGSAKRITPFARAGSAKLVTPFARVGNARQVGSSARARRAKRVAALNRDAAAALREVGLNEQAVLTAASLSQGQRKRLELALVLALQPRVLLLDEPTAGMGVGERAQIMELVMAAVGRRALTMLFTEHDVETVFAHARRVVVMDRGVLVADGLPQAVRHDPDVQRIYLGSQEGDGAS